MALNDEISNVPNKTVHFARTKSGLHRWEGGCYNSQEQMTAGVKTEGIINEKDDIFFPLRIFIIFFTDIIFIGESWKGSNRFSTFSASILIASLDRVFFCVCVFFCVFLVVFISDVRLLFLFAVVLR